MRLHIVIITLGLTQVGNEMFLCIANGSDRTQRLIFVGNVDEFIKQEGKCDVCSKVRI